LSPARPGALAFTLGDPAGVGPRSVLLALRSGVLPRGTWPLLVGNRSAWVRAGWRPADGFLHDTRLGVAPPRLGAPSAAGGKLSAASFEAALDLIARGLVSGIVTAPVSKESWSLAGYPWRDHTERLAAAAPGASVEMVLGVPSRNLWCVLATRHIPLKEVARAVTPARVRSAASVLAGALRRLGTRRPRLAVCGLNPHAGENGLIGTEEKRLPATLPADSAWRLLVEGDLDGLVCLYHDQALIPLKALGGLSGINWSAGLPFPRVSPAHGTAWDAAKAGKCDPSATIEAARLAARLVSAP
jgi:4-hydroxythreonine-4-phosphate dehydrogenase